VYSCIVAVVVRRWWAAEHCVLERRGGRGGKVNDSVKECLRERRMSVVLEGDLEEVKGLEEDEEVRRRTEDGWRG
jgi:hypothetical protein